ncbi:DUF5129 domain-containing protein [Corynebacterium cystitidis]|uniref:DUF5129 domain-containing protein n=1 Tax=Corynebacterium cystitidis TaxID=35757 RepID=UPI00211E78A8|nr:DUF5129 domain-containing protein [Corynebacterium cystitidis]
MKRLVLAAASAVLIVSTPAAAWAQSGPAVTVEDADGMLHPGDRQRLYDETANQGLPDVVDQVDYLLFGTNDENLNDTVEEFAREHRPDLIAPDDDHFADGHLIVSVGFDPRMNGVYCGEDVCEALDIRQGAHLDGSINAAKDYLRDGQIATAMLASVRHAGDMEAAARDHERQQEADRNVGIGLGVGAGILAVGIGGTVWYARRKKRQARIDEARGDYAYVMEHYADTAYRLDAIDVRAHSLTSPLANSKMRGEWADVRDRFLELDATVQSFRGLQASSDDDTFHEHYEELNTAEETTLQVITAEENIETLYKVEHGDAGARLEILNDLKKDLVDAETSVNSDSLRQRVTEQITQVDELRRDLHSDDFLDRFVVLLSDVAIVLAAVDQQEFSDVDRETERVAPRLYESDYRVGTGVNNYVPFFMLSRWHDSDVAAHEAAQSSTNTSFSSGFSGGGGSSRW